MLSKVSVLVPTRGRLARLQTLCTSFEETTHGVGAELVFRVDEDDVPTQVALAGRYKTVVGPRLQGYSSMATFFNDALRAAEGDVLMCGNDDMVFRTEGWPALVLAEANKYADGKFCIGVSTFNEDHFPFSIVSRKVASTLGFLWDPRIYWGDIYLRDVMAAFGRCVMLPSVVVDHNWAGDVPDQTFQEENQNDIYRREPNYWATTHAQAVREAVQKLAPRVHVCVPVLKRYDLLRALLESLVDSTLRPHSIRIIDNGQNPARVEEATRGFEVWVLNAAKPMGVAESWNWFIEHVPEERLITNDDIEFAPTALAAMVAEPEAFVSCGFGFSCFLLRDACVRRIGRFDESISPGYAYFEDMDYLRRMRAAGVADKVVRCGVKHGHSQTPAAYSGDEWVRHHERFMLAQQNYEAKWAGAPSWDQLKEIGG